MGHGAEAQAVIQAPPDVLRFEPEDHLYFLNEKPLMGLTDFLASLGFSEWLKYVNHRDLERARAKGTAVHKGTELSDKGTLDESSIAPEIKPYLDAWKEFVAMERIQIIQIEKPIYSKKWRFACTPDRVIMRGNKFGVLEIKASDYLSGWFRLQTEGQRIAASEYYGINVTERFVVRLMKAGKPRLEQFKSAIDHERFICALKTEQFKREEC